MSDDIEDIDSAYIHQAMEAGKDSAAYAVTLAKVDRDPGSGMAPCCAFGSHPDDFNPIIAALAMAYAATDGRSADSDDIDAAASAVVNCHGSVETVDIIEAIRSTFEV